MRIGALKANLDADSRVLFMIMNAREGFVEPVLE